MKMNYKSIGTGSLLAGLLFVQTQPVFAYIDPGTGSMLLQGLLAGVAGLVVVLKLYWFRIKNFFFPKSAVSPSLEPEPATENPAENQTAENQD
jgi:hypothetical protein